MKPYEIILSEDAYEPRDSPRRWSAYAKVSASSERRGHGKTPQQALEQVLAPKSR